jgi:predicted metal-dependent hydrolase
MKQITVSNITIDVIKKDIKNIHLAVYPPTGRVRIATPMKTSDESIRLFAISKLGWIKKHQRNFNKQNRLPVKEFINRESHFYLGKRYLLNVVENEGKPSIKLHHRKIEVLVRSASSSEVKDLLLTNWYRNQLKLLIPPLISKWEKILNVKVNHWGVRKMKTKWGSCSVESQRILLNLELIKKPVACLEYIIAHELVHLLERHHNERFLAILSKHLPNWKFLKQELNRFPLDHTDWDY